MEHIHLLFGPFQSCAYYAADQHWTKQEWKHIGKESDFMQYRNVSLVPVHLNSDYYRDLYEAAKNYFVSHGCLVD